jgi:hypothetical protein
MGRRASGGLKPKKRKRVTVQLLKRMHAGEVTEPYRVMEELLKTEHGHLEGVKIAIAWRLGWRADTDGYLKIGQCRKRGDLDRELDTFDFVIMLNKEAFPTLSDKQKRAVIDHELCHAKVVVDTDGNPKRDDRDRLVCRIRKHDVEEFRDVVERHGLYTAHLSAIAQAAINDAKRPLLAAAERGDGNGKTTEPAAERAGDAKPGAAASTPDVDESAAPTDANKADKSSWRRMKIAELQMPASVEGFVIDAGKKTLGAFADYMADKGDFWDRDLQVGGQRKPPRFRATIEDAWAEFWAEHPEFCTTPAKV